MAAVHPIIKIHDLIDEIKECTQPINTKHQQELNGLFGELEDLLIMLASKDTNDDMIKVSKVAYSIIVRKATKYDGFITYVNSVENKEDVDSDEETGGGSGDR